MLLDKFFVASVCYLFLFSAVSADDDSDESKEDNDKDEADICKLPPIEPGPFACLGHFPKWTFDSKAGVCKLYVYGGCRGTKNLFSTEKECAAKCVKKSSVKKKSSDAKSASSSPCSLPVARGNCRASIPSFYFHSASGQCVEFTYTGCKGNANNFVSRDDCEKTCAVESQTPPPKGVKGVSQAKPTEQGEICNLPPESPASGIRCMAYIPSWTFNSSAGQCERYVYGGCGRTANLFKTEDECNAVCGLSTRKNRETCLLPVDKGPCMGMASRYAFVKEKNRCEPFTYGLCQGNENNFKTADECFKQCGGELPADKSCQGVVCPVTNKRYLERGCRPEYKGNACCPTNFVCPEEKATGTCHYRGLTFRIGDSVPLITQDHPCKTECACVASSEHHGGATIKCTETVCPMPKFPENEANCVLVTKPDKCCPKFKCDDDSSEEKQEKICIYKGKSYLKGENIPTGDPCKTCTCTEGFSGPDGLGCRNVHCLIDNRVGCVPVYDDKACCPTSYRCAHASSGNSSRIIRTESGEQAAVTLPFHFGKERSNIQVKSDSCLLPKETGPCRMYRSAFYYDADQQKCLPFFYGGCKGNANRFENEEACIAACHVTEEDTQQLAQQQQTRTSDLTIDESVPVVFGAGSRQDPALPQRCNFPMNTGPCRMSIQMFYYDAEAKDCRLFYYGGCKGNPNKFETIEECRQACLVSNSIDSVTNEVEQVSQNEIVPSQETATTTTTETPATTNTCELPLDEGPCKGHAKAFAYNPATGKCEAFWYGGCRGNANRFETEEECLQQCASPSSAPIQQVSKARSSPQEDPRAICKLPFDIGYCRSFVDRFYYDEAENRCNLFSYGGCMGNGNNFATAQECLAACQVPIKQTGTKGGDDVLPAGRARARNPFARARARGQFEEEPLEIVTRAPVEPSCTLLNVTIQLGEKIETDDPCEECTCSTPPEITCVHHVCPEHPLANDPSAVCKQVPVPGKCCPQVHCVSASPPTVDECQAERLKCPKLPNNPNMICKEKHVPGRCCPDFACVSANPPTVTRCEVERPKCPKIPKDPSMICKEKRVPGKCCPDIECVSANPPVVVMPRRIDACKDKTCPEPPSDSLATCEANYIAGDCCPTYVCKPNEHSIPIECQGQTEQCPTPPNDPSMLCRPNYVPGRCCPDYSCVSANPPFIDVCEGVVCESNEHCEVREQESDDGSWKPPVGACVTNP